MMRRLLVLNLVLVAVLIAMAVRFHNDWINFEATHQIAAIQPEPEAVPKVASVVIGNAGSEDWVLMDDATAQGPREYARSTAAPPAVVSTSQPTPAASSPLTIPPPQQPSAGQPRRRRILQQTPFGVREIEVDE